MDKWVKDLYFWALKGYDLREMHIWDDEFLSQLDNEEVGGSEGLMTLQEFIERKAK